jgi:PAS domain S-box-containing protein
MALEFDDIVAAFPDRYQVLAADPPHFTIKAVSDKYLEMVNRRREDLLGQPVFVAFPAEPDSPAETAQVELRESFMNVIEQGEANELEPFRYDISDNGEEAHERWWRVINSPICDDSGQVVAVLNRVEDITELKTLQVRESVQTGKAASLGRFFLERAALWGLLIFVTYAVLGVLAWGLVESNRNSKSQIAQLEGVVRGIKDQSQQNENLLKELKTSQELLRDCSTPGGKCFEDQIAASSVGAALASISGTVLEYQACIDPVPVLQRTEEKVVECIKKAREYQANVITQTKQNGKG